MSFFRGRRQWPAKVLLGASSPEISKRRIIARPRQKLPRVKGGGSTECGMVLSSGCGRTRCGLAHRQFCDRCSSGNAHYRGARFGQRAKPAVAALWATATHCSAKPQWRLYRRAIASSAVHIRYYAEQRPFRWPPKRASTARPNITVHFAGLFTWRSEDAIALGFMGCPEAGCRTRGQIVLSSKWY